MENYILLHKGNTVSLELWKKRTRMFNNICIKKEGAEFSIYVDRKEFNALKKIFDNINVVAPDKEWALHYYQVCHLLWLIDKFNREN